VLAALRSRNYLLFWSGSLVANVGMWMQQIALGWLVYEMTRSASLLGTVSFCGNLPFLFLGLLGGAIADRASRRTIMLGTQLVLAAAAAALAALTATGHLAIWQVILIAMLCGTAGALYAPAMQSVIPALVDPGQLLNAISLNAVQFNLARTVGPALAALAYGTIGPAGCFALNAAGFLVLTALLSRIRLPRRTAAAPSSMRRALGEGLAYARAHAVIGPALFLAAVMSLFGFPYIILLPALARDALHLESASGLGYLMAAVGGGAVAGGLGLSAAGDLPRKGLVAATSALLFGAVLATFSVVRSLAGTAALLFVLGVLQTACVASVNTTIQTTVRDGMRGRVMSMLTMSLFGFATVGGLAIGILADHVGIPFALASGGIVIMVSATSVILRAPDLLARPEAEPRVAGGDEREASHARANVVPRPAKPARQTRHV
jgi:MFS family permease